MNAPRPAPLFYLDGKTIHKRPIERKEGDKTVVTVGFPVCTVSEFVDEKGLCQFLNENAG